MVYRWRPDPSGYVGSRIRDVLAERERTEAWLARKMGVNASTVHRMNRGQCTITRNLAARASRALGVPEAELFIARGDIHPSMDNIAVDTEREAEHVAS